MPAFTSDHAWQVLVRACHTVGEDPAGADLLRFGQNATFRLAGRSRWAEFVAAYATRYASNGRVPARADPARPGRRYPHPELPTRRTAPPVHSSAIARHQTVTQPASEKEGDVFAVATKLG